VNSLNKIRIIIDELFKTSPNIVITIDGNSCSGKTTLANQLKKIYNCNVIHMDDYFLPLNKRTKERLLMPGGNINFEKFYDDIIKNLGKDLVLEAFDCKTKSFKDKQIISHNKLTIVEGSYSLHPYFGKYYNFSICLHIDPIIQLNRLKVRENINIDNFINKWIPLENKYFDYYNIFKNCDLLININK